MRKIRTPHYRAAELRALRGELRSTSNNTHNSNNSTSHIRDSSPATLTQNKADRERKKLLDKCLSMKGKDLNLDKILIVFGVFPIDLFSKIFCKRTRVYFIQEASVFMEISRQRQI